MKKIMLLCLIVGLTFGIMGATCSTNILKVICDPPPAVLAVVGIAAPFVAYALSILVEGSTEWATAANVDATITAIQKSICVSGDQLTELITFLKSDTYKSAEAKMMMTKWIHRAPASKMVSAADIATLEEWAKSRGFRK